MSESDVKNNETNSQSTIVQILERPADLTNVEAIKEMVANLNAANRVKIDDHNNYLVMVKLGEGLILNSVNVRRYAPTNQKPDLKAVTRAFVTLRFGMNGEFVSDGWRLVENVTGEKAGQWFLGAPSYESKGTRYDMSFFVATGVPSLVASIVKKVYDAVVAKGEQLTDAVM